MVQSKKQVFIPAYPSECPAMQYSLTYQTQSRACDFYDKF